MKRNALAVVLIMLVLATLACNLSGPSAETSPTPGGEAAGAVTPTPTLTPAPDVSTQGGCTLNGAFVADVTVPDNTEFPPSTPFRKTWRLRNTGTCTWEAGTQLVFVSGDPMGGPASVPVGVVAPGATVDVSVDLVAPPTPGTYKGNWQLQAPDGTLFGSVVYVQIVVPEPPTPSPAPTEAPTAEPTEAPTEEPTEEPTLEIPPIIFTPVIPVPPITFVADIEAHYMWSTNCGGTWVTLFSVKNTGTLNLESANIRLHDLTSGVTSPAIPTNVFDLAQAPCAWPSSPSERLEPDVTGYIIVQANLASGHEFEAIVRACTEDDLGGTCVEATTEGFGAP